MSRRVEHRLNLLKDMDKMSKNTDLSIAHQQYELRLEIAVEKEIDGVPTFLAGRGSVA